MKKYLTSALFLILFCSNFAFAGQQPLERLNVALDWAPNPDHAPLLIALQQGFFKAQGLDVKLISPNGVKDAPHQVAQNQADIGITYEPKFMEQVDQGLPLIQIGTLIDKPLSCLVIDRDTGSNHLADLKGKQIIESNDGLDQVLYTAMLKKQGLADDKIEYVNVRYKLTQALLSHQVQAATGLKRNVEVPALEAQGHSVLAYFPEEYGVPNYSELIFISNIAKQHDPRFPRFLAALRQAVAYMDDHPEATWQNFIKAYPKANTTMNHTAWLNTMPYFAEDPADVNEKEWQHFADFMQKHHLIKKAQPISRYVVAFNE